MLRPGVDYIRPRHWLTRMTTLIQEEGHVVATYLDAG